MSKILVLYDSWCPICMRVKENIHKLDWFNLIELKSIREENNLNIPITDLEKEMYCINVETGKITKGIDAIASISARLPLMMLFWLPLKLSSYFVFGHKLYNYIAKTRRIIPVNNCDGDTCNIK
ncbi:MULTISPECIES: thiol-disulfide oxidoreductase DCC family protein [Anoxybacillaceae]|uniref:thiol-disulfide oxidoreductase DCC family protein n=1 Tax=Anoxybacillaceae TaxID=3120669 RepID=UPI0009B9A2AB|nr:MULTISPECIES: DUF393 domain-containing protein [Anoxybacillus]MBB3908745.1 putative DCC family thiol-disulfide oxidoreductase YuxK [Anoxybacillus rupiensis]OQM46720.1 hypothetical protein B6A27_06105 [Anoxybacillus sp. UARK-01]